MVFGEVAFSFRFGFVRFVPGVWSSSFFPAYVIDVRTLSSGSMVRTGMMQDWNDVLVVGSYCISTNEKMRHSLFARVTKNRGCRVLL
jgi:hypothetical protein